MPQATIEYSSNVAASFDARGFALRLHQLLVEFTATDLESCKTRLIELQDVIIGNGSPDEAMIHVELGILSGRTPEQKTNLGKATLAAARSFLLELPGQLQLTVAVVDMDSSNYHKVVLTKEDQASLR